MLAAPFFYLTGWNPLDVNDLVGMAQTGAVCWGIVLAFVAILGFVIWRDDRRYREPSILATRIKDWREKRCTLLEFKE